MKRTILLWIIAALLVATSLSCQMTGEPAPPVETNTPLPTFQQAEETRLPTEASPASNPTALPTQAAAPTATAAPASPTQAPPSGETPSLETCAEEVCILDGAFLLGRPVGQPGRTSYNVSNRYGDYQRSTRNTNLGSQFLNSTGTPVVAAADGEVVVAGDDSQTAYSSQLNNYGNLVILEHSLPGVPEPVYTLYAHLSEVLVEAGDTVAAGQEIGRVGMSGNVGGSILHFEVRRGENKPEAAVNPELWLVPLTDDEEGLLGALAGSITDANGDFIDVRNVVLERLAGPGQPALDQYYLKTYSDNDLSGHEPWKENFAAGDLPPGTYQISVWLGQMHQKIVEIQPGKLTVVNFQIK